MLNEEVCEPSFSSLHSLILIFNVPVCKDDTSVHLTIHLCQEWLSHLFSFSHLTFHSTFWPPKPGCPTHSFLLALIFRWFSLFSQKECFRFFFSLTVVLCWFSEFSQLSEQPVWEKCRNCQRTGSRTSLRGQQWNISTAVFMNCPFWNNYFTTFSW